MMRRPKVSVIIPIYGVEKYIERCARSLFEQTLDDIEYIFVDDCSPDRSNEILQEILQEYPNRLCQTKILCTKKNSKQASSRNIGLKNATGEYIIHCDPDDWVELSMYEELYNEAKKTNADIVVCDYFAHSTSETRNIEYNSTFLTPQDIISYNIRETPWYLWDRLVKGNIIRENKIFFFDNVNFTEDRFFLIRVYYYAKSIEYIHKPLYHYNKTNPNSSVKSKNIIDKIEQKEIGIIQLEKWFKERTTDYNNFIEDNKFWIKEEFCHSLAFQKFKNTFPELNNKYLYSENAKGSIFTRLIYFLTTKNIIWPFKLFFLQKIK